MNGTKNAMGGNKPQQPPQQERKPLRQVFQRWFGILLILFLLLFFFIEKEAPSAYEAQVVKRQIPLDQCPAFCKARSNQLNKHRGGDLLDNKYLLKAAEKARDGLHTMLKEDYGEDAFKSMWVNPTTGKVIGERALASADSESNVSYDKFRRKLQMKALQVQIQIMDEQQNLKGCDCTDPTHRRRLQEQTQTKVVLPDIPPFYERFVWATGGHSAAAAHGNLYNESYTSYMERGVKDLFHAVGIDFVGRNYAMGGMDSAPQLALCNEAVYGKDADVISWDFGMTDGGQHFKTTLYASRIGMHTNRPAHVSINNGGRNYKKRMNALKLAEEAGVPTLQLLPNVEDGVVKGAPDSFGLSDKEMKKMGPFAANYKCKNAVEKEAPCQAEKYNVKVCPDRKFKASWHPGWRQHAVTGNVLALFLAETMIDALKELTKSSENPRELYAKLKKEEDTEYESFFNSTVPDETAGLVSAELVAAGMKSQYLYRSKAICKTALLPAQTRYLGFLTESSEKGELHGFFKGADVKRAAENPPQEKDKSDMVLVYEEAYRQKCSVDLNNDYKDYFYATQDWGWASLKFPNDAEVEAYAPDGFSPIGVVVICFYKCDWGKCPKGEVDQDGFNTKWKLELNGEPVSELSQMDQCFAVKTKDGFLHKPNTDGRYELRVWMAPKEGNENNFVRITSVVVL